MILSRRAFVGRWAAGAAAAPLLHRFPAVLVKEDDVEAFLRAVRTGDIEGVRALLARDATLVASRDPEGRSALVLAHLAGHADVARQLRQSGLEREALDVVEAVFEAEWERVEQLLTGEPALCGQAHAVGGTPLYAMALAGSAHGWRVRALGCAPDAAPAGGSGWTPARAAMECPRPVGAWIAASDMLGNGSDANAPQRGGDSVLHGAVRRRSDVLVRLAIRKGARVDAEDERGRTARALAEELGWSEGATLLADHATIARDHRASRFAWDANGDPVNRVDISDVPFARQREVTGSSHTDLPRVRELLRQDPRLVWSISGDDELAIEASAHMGNRPLLRLHLDHGAPMSLPTAVAAGDIEGARRLLQRDPLLIHERGAHDFPVLWYLVLGEGSVELGELLLEAGVGLEQESVGVTALHWCVVRRQADLARWLIEKGADVGAVGYKWSEAGQTPLQLAEERGVDELVDILRAAGG